MNYCAHFIEAMMTFNNFNDHKKAMARLRAVGVGGYVVLSVEGAKAGLGCDYPLGIITSLRAPISVGVRRIGRSKSVAFAAGFWRPMPNRLVNRIREGDL